MDLKNQIQNREIKFRAWLEGTHENMTIEVPKMEYDILLNNGIYHIEGWGSYTTIPIMQFTGLHDKNGKEIYEGDIVKWGMHNGSEEHWHRYAVVEINPDIQFRILFYILSETGERKLTDNDVLHYGRFAYKDTENHLEIIGNIYENPELLSGGEK